jgi:hypothetical protein
MATAFDIITSALRLTGVLSSDEQPNDNDANQGLSVFNDMIDGWNAERNCIFTTRSDDFPFVLNQQAYTLGSGGNFNIPRPPQIDSMSTILLSNPANPIEIPITMFTVEDWQNKVPVKEVSGSFPLICYDDGGFPLRTLNFWPIPTQVPNIVRIYSWQALAQPATLQTSVSFPPGYAEAFRYNLAVRIGAEFAAPASATVAALAIQSLARVKTMNAPDLELRSDLVPYPAGYNYRADLFGMGF